MSQQALVLAIALTTFLFVRSPLECSRYSPIAVITYDKDIPAHCSGYYIITMVIALLLIAAYNDKYVDRRRY